jgi:hypothetical protein
MQTEQIAELLHARAVGSDRWRGKCPVHGGRSLGSLSIGRGTDGRTLLICRAGCTAKAICESIGIRMADLFSDSRSAGREVRNRAQEFDEWRSTCQRILTDRLRHLCQKADSAARVLARFPDCEPAWNALANFYHCEAELRAALDLLSFEKVSPWLETPMTSKILAAAFDEAVRLKEQTDAA